MHLFAKDSDERKTKRLMANIISFFKIIFNSFAITKWLDVKDLIPKLRETLILLFLIMTFNGSAQSLKEKKIYKVNVNENDYSVVAEVFAKEGPLVRADEDKEYYWYKSNNIMVTKGGYDGKLLSGQYSSFYLNNNLKEKGKFLLGLKQGKWTKWYDNGTVAEISNWKKGLKYGLFQTFNTKQELTMSAHYSKDRLHGEVITYEGGKAVSKKKYNHGEEIISKEKIPVKKEEKPENKKTEPTQTKEVVAPQDSTQKKTVPVKKVVVPKKEPEKKKK